MKHLLLAIVILFSIKNANAQLLAFPTAEGAGKFTTGGRGSVAIAPTIYEVTNLTDVNTVGSFRYACTNGTAARIVVFRVSGIVHLTARLDLKANTTIAGQTAPGGGICVSDYPIYLGGNNIIVRYLRFRLSDRNQLVTTPTNCGLPVTPFANNPACVPTPNASGNDDAFGDNGGGRSNIVIDHCTMSWSNDEAFTMYKGSNVTIQWNLLSEPLNYSYHVEPGDVDYERHAYGGIWGGANTSAHHNLIAHCNGRMPRFDGIRNSPTEIVDFRNNVIYNWGSYNTNGGEGGTYNIVNNYYKYGPNTTSSVSSGVNRRSMLINPYQSTSAPVLPFGKYFLTGNYCDNSATVTANNWLGATFSGGALSDSATSKVTIPFAITNINTETALEAYNSVLSSVGCSLPNRDTLDARVVNDVINRTGGIIDVQGNYPHGTPYITSQLAWPILATGVTQTDTDHDGIPDNWEDARGLNKALATDANNYNSANGYNNIENYINGDTIVAVGTNNNCITAKKIIANNSGKWIFAKDSLYSNYLSTKYTASVDSNHIVVGILDNGNFGNFTISYYTTDINRVANGIQYARRNITITPATPATITGLVTVRLYLSVAEFNALKAADNTISTITDIQITKSNDATCITAMPTTITTITPTSTAVFGSYQNGYVVEFQTSTFGTFFFQSKNTATGIFNVNAQNNKLEIYPNPVKGNLYIQQTIDNPIKTLIVYNYLGKVVLQKNIEVSSVNTFNFNVSSLQPGNYTVKAIGKKYTSIAKFIK